MNRQDFLRLSLLAPLLSAGVGTAAEREVQPFSGFVDLMYRQKRVREAFEKYVIEDYVQHSLGMAQGRDAAIAVLTPMFARVEFSATPLRTLHTDQLLVVLLDVKVGDSVRAMVIDIFRHHRGKLMEHWDAKVEIPAEQRAHYFDGMN